MDFSSLAALAGNALVSAAVTDAWEATRQGFARLFGKGEADAATERRLDDTSRQLAVLTPSELESTRATLAAEWALRLRDLLEDDPDAARRLSALVEQIQAILPERAAIASDHSVAAAGDMTIAASSGGIAAGMIHGNVTPGPQRPDSASV